MKTEIIKQSICRLFMVVMLVSVQLWITAHLSTEHHGFGADFHLEETDHHGAVDLHHHHTHEHSHNNHPPHGVQDHELSSVHLQKVFKNTWPPLGMPLFSISKTETVVLPRETEAFWHVAQSIYQPNDPRGPPHQLVFG